MSTSWKQRALSVIRSKAPAPQLASAKRRKRRGKKNVGEEEGGAVVERKVAEDFFSALAEPDNAEEREKALDFIRVFLPELQNWSEATVLLLWRGLWTCMWHSDRPLVQLETATRIAKLVNFVKRERESELRISKPVLWVAGFWKQAISAWPQLDFFRIDKFLRLTRYMLFVLFRVLQEPTTTGRDVVFAERVVVAALAADVKGLSLHVCDVWLDEAERAALPGDLHTRLLCAYFTVFAVATRMSNASFLERALKHVFCDRLLVERAVEFDLPTIVKKVEKSRDLCKRVGKPTAWAKEVLKVLEAAQQDPGALQPVKFADEDYLTKYHSASLADRKARRKEKLLEKKTKKHQAERDEVDKKAKPTKLKGKKKKKNAKFARKKRSKTAIPRT